MKRPLSPVIPSQTSLYFTAVVAFLYLRTFFLPGTPVVASGDEAIYFTHGIRILQGQVPFRDYFTYVMPGMDLFYAVAFKVLGIHAWMVSAFLIGLGFGIAAVLLQISRSVLSGSTVYLPGLLFLVLDFDVTKDATHHWYSTLLILTALALLLHGRSLRRIALAGTLCGIAAVFTQSQGLLSAIVIAAFLMHEVWEDSRLRSLRFLALAIPFATISGSVVGYYIYRAGFATMYSSLVTFVFHNFPSLRAHSIYIYTQPVPEHHTLGGLTLLVPYFFIHLFLPFGYFFCLYRLWRDKKDKPEPTNRNVWQNMMLINLVGLALFAAVANAPTYRRMSMVAPLASVVCVWLLAENAWLRRVLWMGAIALVLVRPLQLQLHWHGYMDLPTGRAATVEPVNYGQIEWFLQHTRPGESFFYNPQLAFILKLDNPTTIDYPTPTAYTTPQQVDDAIRGLQQHQTPLLAFYDVLYRPAPDLFAPRRPRKDSMGPFYAYVYQNYHLMKVLPGMTVWERN